MNRCKIHKRRGYGPCSECVDLFGRDPVYDRSVVDRKKIGKEVRSRRKKEPWEKTMRTISMWSLKAKRAHRKRVEAARLAGIIADRERRKELIDEAEKYKQEWLAELEG